MTDRIGPPSTSSARFEPEPRAFDPAPAASGGNSARTDDLAADYGAATACVDYLVARATLGSATKPLPAANNAERTSLRDAQPYIAANADSATCIWDAGVAVLKGQTAQNGLTVESFSASAQIGLQNELQVGMLRLGAANPNGSVSMDVFAARANAGIYNDDGSIGVNASLGVTAIGVEGTLNVGEASFTAGTAISLGASFSVGVRDKDADGNAEWCARVSAGPFNLGLCVED